jgi:Na+-driven multidrug efflux pump
MKDNRVKSGLQDFDYFVSMLMFSIASGTAFLTTQRLIERNYQPSSLVIGSVFFLAFLVAIKLTFFFLERSRSNV